MSAVVTGLRRLTRAAVRRTARDVSATVAGRSALVIAPHPDDETLGCGATILRKVAAGTAVTVLVVSDGSGSHRSAYLPPEELAALRRTEMAEAARRLGLAPGAVRWAGLVDGTVAAHEELLAGLLGELLAELRPAEVYATCADEPHPDHAAVGRAARRAVAADPAVQLLEYPIWLWTAWPLRHGARFSSAAAAVATLVGRRAVRVRADGHLPAKLHALRAHRSQLAPPAGVPAEEPWPALPPDILATAAGPAELFLPVPRAGPERGTAAASGGRPARRAGARPAR